MATDLYVSENESQFEEMIRGLTEQGYGLADNFLDPATCKGLRDQLLQHHAEGDMHPAGIGKNFDFQRNLEIRGDVIRWISEESPNPPEAQLLGKVRHFVDYLNRTCYTGLNGFEFHYAYYEAGSFYKRHKDQFRSDRGRKFSLVVYLNEGWQETDGGHLSLYADEGEIRITPLEGRAVFFAADQTEHEVHPAPDRYRLSIAGWLKN